MDPEPRVTWVLESAAFSSGHATLIPAIAGAGHRVVQWDDGWWKRGDWPDLGDAPVVFQGSLGNAARVRAGLPWRPGAFCDVRAFCCSTWYPLASEWLVHRQWRIIPAHLLVEDPAAAVRRLGDPGSVFVRPDSPLKPFAGRVLAVDKITLPALDHGFYYDDPTIPVVVAPVRAIGREWRYVVVDQVIVAGSAYAAADRAARADDPRGAAWSFAAEIAAKLPPPERVYVLDVCETDDRLWLLEINPFSGADLYACAAADLVAAVSTVAASEFLREASNVESKIV
jgi:hypothetical protein